MDSITELIKNEIKKQYKSVKQFSELSGIPYSTISNALSRGVGGTSYDTVIRICQILEIQQACNNDILLFNKEYHDIYSQLSALDEQGLHTVCTILKMEYERCKQSNSVPIIKAFNGSGMASLKKE